MSDDATNEIAETLERLTRAIDGARIAEIRADARTAAADARISDAKAQIDDAEAQTAHADSHMTAAKAHMTAARAQMGDADARVKRAGEDQETADAQTKEAGRLSQGAIDDSDEYQRALYHYQQLVRHRIANPLQIIIGIVHTLLNHRDLNEAKHWEMLSIIGEQAHLIERHSIFSPNLESIEEHGLRPKPFE